MAAYAIARLDIHSASWLKEYGPVVEALLRKHGGRYLVRGGGGERVEGSGDAPNATVVVEFPDLEHARAWYNDPDYQPMIALRRSGSDGELVLIEGV